MIVKKELIAKIKDYFDLNVYETKVWLALLSKGIGSAGEIAELSGIPRSRTYDVLESLEKRGFAISKIGKPVKYIGVKPNIILEKLKNNVRKDAEERLETLAKMKEMEEFASLELLYKQGINPVKREDLSAAIKGRAMITNHIRDVLANAKKEVIVCTSADEVFNKLKLFEQTFETLKKGNIQIKFALHGDERLVKEVSKKVGVPAQIVDHPAKFFIVDRNEILFYVSKQGEEDLAIWLNSEFFAQAFASLFERATQ